MARFEVENRHIIQLFLVYSLDLSSNNLLREIPDNITRLVTLIGQHESINEPFDKEKFLKKL
jgi:hypothetical protein